MLNFEPPRSNVVITGPCDFESKVGRINRWANKILLLSTFGAGAILKEEEEEEEEAITKGWQKMGPEKPKPITHIRT